MPSLWNRAGVGRASARTCARVRRAPLTGSRIQDAGPDGFRPPRREPLPSGERPVRVSSRGVVLRALSGCIFRCRAKVRGEIAPGKTGGSGGLDVQRCPVVQSRRSVQKRRWVVSRRLCKCQQSLRAETTATSTSMVAWGLFPSRDCLDENRETLLSRRNQRQTLVCPALCFAGRFGKHLLLLAVLSCPGDVRGGSCWHAGGVVMIAHHLGSKKRKNRNKRKHGGGSAGIYTVEPYKLGERAGPPAHEHTRHVWFCKASAVFAYFTQEMSHLVTVEAVHAALESVMESPDTREPYKWERDYWLPAKAEKLHAHIHSDKWKWHRPPVRKDSRKDPRKDGKTSGWIRFLHATSRDDILRDCMLAGWSIAETQEFARQQGWEHSLNTIKRCRRKARADGYPMEPASRGGRPPKTGATNTLTSQPPSDTPNPREARRGAVLFRRSEDCVPMSSAAGYEAAADAELITANPQSVSDGAELPSRRQQPAAACPGCGRPAVLEGMRYPHDRDGRCVLCDPDGPDDGGGRTGLPRGRAGGRVDRREEVLETAGVRSALQVGDGHRGERRRKRTGERSNFHLWPRPSPREEADAWMGLDRVLGLDETSERWLALKARFYGLVEDEGACSAMSSADVEDEPREVALAA